ncbi:MAG: hypothetical protein ACAI25_08020 [Planctomycetota bacterium]
MDVQMSKKAKIAIAIVMVLAAAPLYFASNPGMDRIIKSQWDKASETKTPENLYKAIVFYGISWREDKQEELIKEWLKHYGGDESEKEFPFRYHCWEPILLNRTFPYDGEAHVRPPQKGEDFRPTPHPLTAKVLIIWANHLENNHRLQEAVHLYKLIDNQEYCSKWNLERDPDSYKQAVSGIQRNGSGSRSF